MNERDLELLDAWRHGEISEDEFRDLEKRLESEPELRANLRALADVEEGLSALSIQPLPIGLESPAAEARSRNPFIYAGWAAAAVLLLALVVSSNWKTPDNTNNVTQRPNDAAIDEPFVEPPVAVLTRAIDLEWQHRSRFQAELGQPITEKYLRVESGIAEVSFSSGATVRIEGPAKLRIDSAMKCFSHSGKLTANCPPSAHGFTIRFRGGQVVDLGTEFALNSQPEGKTEVHVLNGEVTVALTDDSENVLREQSLKGNSAVELNPETGGIDAIKYDGESFGNLQRDALIQSQPIKLQFDLGHRAGLYEGTNSPAHAAGDMFAHENVWTQLVGDQSGTFVMADGNLCPHPVRVDYGHGDGVIDWNATPVDPTGRIWTKAEPFFNTALCQDHRPWDFDLGLRIAGLPAGTFRVYALCRSIRRPSASYDVSFGVNLERQLATPTPLPSMDDLTGVQWEAGLTYAVADVKVTSPEDWVTFITRYSRERSLKKTPHHGRSVLLGLQIVEIRD